MRVSLADVIKKFDQLIGKEVEREAISEWAKAKMIAEDTLELDYDPPYEKQRIWDGITYLLGVDLVQDMEGTYLHEIDDFIKTKRSLFDL
ncbi:MAG: hypothetical protein P0S96_01175 [Simkaniaceae bacterium]|nr:hypothetical protein [Candidatus Sacchlamyda saccharinae]